MITNMPVTNANIDELDLHWKDEAPDLGIASEGVCCKDMDEIVERISKVKNTVKKIDLNNQHALTEIPSILKECELLEEINITHTEITSIPDFLFALPNLRSLSCCCRKLTQPPTGLAKAQKLERLHTRINEGWGFPEGLTSLNELKILIIDLYSSAAFPKDMGALKKLESLILSVKYEKGDIQSLPDSLSNHPALKKISISDHVYKNYKVFDLDDAAKILSSCKQFESFALSSLTTGKHAGLSRLTALKELELRHLITEKNIFDSIAALNKLEKLDIGGSEFKITELPDIFDNFKELRSFSFAGNFVPVLPPSLYNLEKLTILEIASTGITSLDEKIGNMKNLVKIHAYDNLLEKLPVTIFTLPGLQVLNIEENIFRQQEIAEIKEKLNALNKNGQKIEFTYDGQGHRQFVKKLRALKDTGGIDIAAYYKHCLDAVNENPYAVKYADKNKLQGRHYAELCMAAIRKTSLALENIDPEKLGKPYYFFICMEAAKCQNIANVFKLIKDNLLTDDEYIQVCIEAALHNRSLDFIDNFNTKSFISRFSREIYERVCWVAVLHYPQTISKMIKPTHELHKLAEQRAAGK